MSSLATLTELPDISVFDDWSQVKQAIQNWSVRDKFTFKTPCKDDKRARYVCTQKGCNFRVTGNKDRAGRITVKVVHREHTCGYRNADSSVSGTIEVADDGQENQSPTLNVSQGAKDADSSKDTKYRNPATQMKWLVTAMERVLDITAETKPHDIQAAAKEYYNEQISYQQAFRCLRLLTADIKEHGHRDRVPDELRKAIVTLRVFLDPPMDWMEIERKTGIKARTAGYIFSSAEKKSGGSKDPFVLLKNATVSPSGPKKLDHPTKTNKVSRAPSRPPQSATFLQTPLSSSSYLQSPTGDSHEDQSQPRKRRRQDEMIDPNLDVAVELARAAADINGDNSGMRAVAETTPNEQQTITSSDQSMRNNQLQSTLPLQRRMGIHSSPNVYTSGSGVEERVLNVLGGQR